MELDIFDDFTVDVSRLTFENVNKMTLEELIFLMLLFVFSFIFAAIISLIIKALNDRKVEEVEWVEVDHDQTNQSMPNIPEPAPEPELSPREKLKKREKDLQERETAMKSEKIRELEEKEKKIFSKAIPDQANPIPDNEIEDMPIDSLEEERDRIRKLLDEAEKRFEVGEINEKNFRTIAEDYQKQILNLEIKVKKKKESGF